MFRNSGLAYKLVEIREINKELILKEWYIKAVEFERVR